jgi:hypothetical protein
MKKYVFLAIMACFLLTALPVSGAKILDSEILYESNVGIPFKILNISQEVGTVFVQMQTEDGKIGVIALVDNSSGLQVGDKVRIDKHMQIVKVVLKPGKPAPGSPEEVKADLEKMIKALNEKNKEEYQKYFAKKDTEKIMKGEVALLLMVLSECYADQFAVNVKGSEALLTGTELKFEMIKEDGRWKYTLGPTSLKPAEDESSPTIAAAPAPVKPSGAPGTYNIIKAPYNMRYYVGKTFEVIGTMGMGQDSAVEVRLTGEEVVFWVRVDTYAGLDIKDLVRLEEKRIIKTGEKASRPIASAKSPPPAREYAERIAVYYGNTLANLGKPFTVMNVDGENGKVMLEFDEGKTMDLYLFDAARVRKCDRVLLGKDMKLARISGQEGKNVAIPKRKAADARMRGWASSLECYMGKSLTVTGKGLKSLSGAQGDKTIGLKAGNGKTFEASVDDDTKLKAGDRVVVDSFSRTIFKLPGK